MSLFLISMPRRRAPGVGCRGGAAGAVEDEEGFVVYVQAGVVAGGDGDFPEAGGEAVEVDFGILDFRFLIFDFRGGRGRGGLGFFLGGKDVFF
jgi:hypothetical protein